MFVVGMLHHWGGQEVGGAGERREKKGKVGAGRGGIGRMGA